MTSMPRMGLVPSLPHHTSAMNALPMGLAGRANDEIGRFLEGSLDESMPLAEPFDLTFEHALRNPEAKRLRMVLTYASAIGLGMELSETEAVRPYAIAAELYHNMSLIHDDLPAQDGSDERRNGASLWRAFGEAEAQLTAGLMLNRADRLVSRADSEHGLEGELTYYVATVLEDLGRGQILDLGLKDAPEGSVDAMELDRIAALKTGKAIEMCVVGPAIILRLPELMQSRLRHFSARYGIAFQIQDDLIDAEQPDDRANYVSVLGADEAQKRLRWHSEIARRLIEPLAVSLDTGLFGAMVDKITDPASHH